MNFRYNIEVSQQAMYEVSDDNECKHALANYCDAKYSTLDPTTWYCESDDNVIDRICVDCKEFFGSKGCGCGKGLEWDNTSRKCSPICRSVYKINIV